jgi:hypothetical protein
MKVFGTRLGTTGTIVLFAFLTLVFGAAALNRTPGTDSNADAFIVSFAIVAAIGLVGAIMRPIWQRMRRGSTAK